MMVEAMVMEEEEGDMAPEPALVMKVMVGIMATMPGMKVTDEAMAMILEVMVTSPEVMAMLVGPMVTETTTLDTELEATAMVDTLGTEPSLVGTPLVPGRCRHTTIPCLELYIII